LKGIYRFYSDGMQVGEWENLITTEGRKAIIDFLSGYNSQFVSHIVVGLGQTAAALSDTNLDLEVDRSEISVVSPDYNNMGVVFKATFSGLQSYKIYEVGAFSSSQGPTPTLISSDFSESWGTGSIVTGTSSRYGSALRLTAPTSSTSSSTLNGVSLDFSQLYQEDKFFISGTANNAFVSGIEVRFMTDVSNYFSSSLSGFSSGSYTISEFTKGSMTRVGSPDWANISSVMVILTSTSGGSASFDFDILGANNSALLSPTNTLVSRSILGSEVIKEAGVPLEVEYTILI
jgi:hypothetical protein